MKLCGKSHPERVHFPKKMPLENVEDLKDNHFPKNRRNDLFHSIKRAQSSMEYITIVGFVFVLLIPLTFIYYDQRGDTSDAINSNHAFKIGKNIADQAETIFYLGEPSRTILKLNFPPKIESVSFLGYEIAITMSTTNGMDDIVIPTSVNVTGLLEPYAGIHNVVITSKGDYVQISE